MAEMIFERPFYLLTMVLHHEGGFALPHLQTTSQMTYGSSLSWQAPQYLVLVLIYVDHNQVGTH